MVKEVYQIRTKEITLNITNSQIDSVRKKNLIKSGCRVYDNGCIGVAGTMGEPTEETWANAERALALGIPYPYAPTADKQRSLTLGKPIDESELIEKSEHLLKTLRENYPEFIFSNKIIASEETVLLKNDVGLDLSDTRCDIVLGIIIKEEASANVFDGVIEYVAREFDLQEALKRASAILDAHKNLLPMPEENVPVLFSETTVSSILGDYLHMQKLKKGASLLSGKEGEKLFSEKLTLCADRGEDTVFFDAEGTTTDKLPLIENGVLVRGVADKQSADEFGQMLTGSASAGYDDVPTLYPNPAALRLNTSGTLEEIMGSGAAIYICMASGGDITPAGDFATPVQTAYLYQDGKLVGRVPEFNFRGNIFDLLGENYIGTSSDKPFDASRLTVLKGQISQ